MIIDDNKSQVPKNTEKLATFQIYKNMVSSLLSVQCFLIAQLQGKFTICYMRIDYVLLSHSSQPPPLH